MAGGHGEHLLEWFTNDSGLGFGAFCDDSLPLPNKNEAEKGSVDDILNSLRGLGLGTDRGKSSAAGTTRKVLEGYEEIYVPARIHEGIADGELQISVSYLPGWAQTAFKGIQTFNRIQSKIFECAHIHRARMFLCAHLLGGGRQTSPCFVRCKKSLNTLTKRITACSNTTSLRLFMSLR